MDSIAILSPAGEKVTTSWVTLAALMLRAEFWAPSRVASPNSIVGQRHRSRAPEGTVVVVSRNFRLSTIVCHEQLAAFQSEDSGLWQCTFASVPLSPKPTIPVVFGSLGRLSLWRVRISHLTSPYRKKRGSALGDLSRAVDWVKLLRPPWKYKDDYTAQGGKAVSVNTDPRAAVLFR